MKDERNAEQLEAQFYDVSVPDWDGEMEFYRQRVARSLLCKAHGLLEIACGTGRVTLRLAEEGIEVTGLDAAPEMLEVAQKKSAGISNIHWILADMRTFELEKEFGGVIAPGHSFMFMTTPDDQVKCLEQIKRHLVDDGLLVLHLDNQNISWQADLIGKRESAREIGRILTHPLTGERFRPSTEWFYEPSTQTATCQDTWDKLDEKGDVIGVWRRAPKRFHCLLRFETEHLLRRVGFNVEAVYGDFLGGELTYESSQMICIARKPVR